MSVPERYERLPGFAYAVQWKGNNSQEVEDWLRELWEGDAWVEQDYFDNSILNFGAVVDFVEVHHRMHQSSWVTKEDKEIDIEIIGREKFDTTYKRPAMA